MKRLLIVIVLLLALLMLAIYIFIPAELEVSKTSQVKVTPHAAYRHLSIESQLEKWWPGSKGNVVQNGDAGKTPNDNISFDVINKSSEALNILILHEGNKFNSTFLFLPLKGNATALHWKCLIKTGNNPIGRMQSYQTARSIRKKMEITLDSLNSYLEKPENVYGISVKKTIVTDTILVVTKANLDHYPTVDDTYKLVKNLRQYIAGQNAKETNYPMLHVEKLDSIRFRTMVGIPVNRPVGNDENLALKRMVPGNILIAQVPGGPHSIKRGFAALELYLSDYGLASPAIPFELLVTDRLTEPDTTKWLTRIYYPIY